jgi:gamma-glutamyltranspeptidase / glutathione hydrolase
MMKRLFALFAAALLVIPAATHAQGVTSSADPRATEAGREILAKGGSATDAALAMMLVLTLVEPQSSGIGGGGFLIHHNASDGSIATIDGRERAPASATPDRFLGKDGKPRGFMEVVPGGLSVGVPGNMRLMEMAHKRWGKLPWADLFAPAIRHAEEGMEISADMHEWMVRFEPLWKDFPEARALYYVDGKLPAVGTRVRNPAYAALLRDMAAKGAGAFYTGGNAKAIGNAVAKAPRNPAVITPADLANYQATPRDAVCAPYRQYKVCGMGPPSSGATTVIGILGMLESFDMKAMGKDSPMAWHVLGEAMQLAYADRELYLGDGDFVEVPVKGLIDKAYLSSRAMAISPYRAAGSYAPGTPPGAPKRVMPAPVDEKGTTHFVAVDRAGNVANYTSTIESVFGSHLVANGYFLNNELTDFDHSPVSARDGALAANRVAPGKRPLSSMSPTIVYGPDGKVVLAVGSAGGKRIIMHVTKTLIGVLDWGLTAQEAINLPNIYFGRAGLLLEDNAAGKALAEKMKVFGYAPVPSDLGSKLNAAQRVGDVWTGAADPRSPGSASVDDSPPQG